MFVCAHMNAAAQRGKEGALALLELELYIVVSHLGARNQNQILWRNTTHS